MLSTLDFTRTQKKPTVQACSNNHSVELGEYHLYKVKISGQGLRSNHRTENIRNWFCQPLDLGEHGEGHFLTALLVQGIDVRLGSQLLWLPTARPVLGV